MIFTKVSAMRLGKLRSLLKYCNCTYIESRPYVTTSRNTIKLLENYFGFSEARMKNLIVKYKLTKLDEDMVKNLLKLFDELGFKKEDIIEHHCSLLKKSPRVVHSKYKALREAGFIVVKPLHIQYYRRCTNKKIKTLKGLNYIPHSVNVAEKLISYLRPQPCDIYGEEFSDDDILSQVHSNIVKRYLMWRLEATQDEIEKFFRVYSGLRFNSLRYMCENIDFACSLGFTPRKLLRFGFLISNYPEYPKCVLQTMSNLAGADMRASMHTFPKLAAIPHWNFTKIYNLLIEAGVTTAAMRNQMNIFTMSPETVRLRVNEIKTIPELKVLLSNPNVLELIYRHNKIRSRLSFLEQLQLKCAGIAILRREEDVFVNKLREGKDINLFREVSNLVKSLLHCDEDLIKYKLKPHPYHLQVPLADIEKTVLYLQDTFDNDSIAQVLPIVLYPPDKIQNALALQHVDKRFSSRKLNPKKRLNLALYCMEKEHHFSGDGVWRTNVTA